MRNAEDYELTGRVAIVTGSGHGIGEGIAEALAERGAKVVVNDLVEERATLVATKLTDLGGTALGISADVSNVESVNRLMRATQESFGNVDILVNNAGAFCLKPFVDHTVEDWDRVFSVNVRGVFLCSRAVLPGMIERRSGNILNIASISTFNTTSEHVAYAASKAAIITMTRDIAAEVAQFGVRVNSVAPGTIDSYQLNTDGKPTSGTLLQRVGQPADIANAVAFLVSDAAGFITGETLPVAGGADLKVDRDPTETGGVWPPVQ